MLQAAFKYNKKEGLVTLLLIALLFLAVLGCEEDEPVIAKQTDVEKVNQIVFHSYNANSITKAQLKYSMFPLHLFTAATLTGGSGNSYFHWQYPIIYGTWHGTKTIRDIKFKINVITNLYFPLVPVSVLSLDDYSSFITREDVLSTLGLFP
ncbi:MAG: hypothetical protein MI866_13380 [Bacteroidales bacterium]|nr:hypothetical protein [Bacteroidales bacterium]